MSNSQHIQSRSNFRVKDLIKKRIKYYFFEGQKLARDLLERGIPIDVLIIHEKEARNWNIPKSADIKETWYVSEMVLTKISELKDTPAAIAVVSFSGRSIDFNAARVVIAADNLQDPGNAGTLFRCAAAFDVDGIVFTGSSVHFNNHKFIRAAQNTLLEVPHMRFEHVDDLIAQAEQAGLNIYLTSSHGTGDSVAPGEIHAPALIVFGGEGRGLDDTLLSKYKTVRIPQSGKVESLNIGVSACIIMNRLYEEKKSKTNANKNT